MILKHRDKELQRFEWVNDTRVRIVSLNEADEKSEQSLVLAAISPRENIRVKSSPSGLNVSEEKVAKLILRNSSITEAEIVNQLAKTFRQVARIIAALKQKAGLKRRGTDKVGEWYFQ